MATVIAEYTGLALGAAMVWRTLGERGVRASWTRILDPARFRHIIAINRDIFIRTLCLIGPWPISPPRAPVWATSFSPPMRCCSTW